MPKRTTTPLVSPQRRLCRLHGRWAAAVIFIVSGWSARAADSANAAATASLRNKVEWTRLITNSPHWSRHSQFDERMLSFFAERTPFAIEPHWKSTSPDNLEDLCSYPFVYAHDIGGLPFAKSRNVAEYLKRGGFLFIDYCIDKSVNPAPSVFFERQVDTLKAHLPTLRAASLGDQHGVFSSYFKMTRFPPQTGSAAISWGGRGNRLHGLFLGERMVGIISLSGFQCAWGGVGSRENADDCMQMVANIYIYAMTH